MKARCQAKLSQLLSDRIEAPTAAGSTLALKTLLELPGFAPTRTSSGWSNDAFIGRERLLEQKEKGVSRKLVGFEMVDRGIARHGYPVMRDGKPAGVVTSGTQTPYLKRSIGMAYVPVEQSATGSEIEIDVRGRLSKARVVKMPFYKRGQQQT